MRYFKDYKLFDFILYDTVYFKLQNNGTLDVPNIDLTLFSANCRFS